MPQAYSLKEVVRALEPIQALQGTGLRDLSKRLRRPAAGPQGSVSLRQMARRIRGRAVVPIRLLSYNTYLLQGLQPPVGRWIDDAVGWDALSWFGIPFGGALLAALGLTSLPGLALAEVLRHFGYTPSKVIRKIAGLNLDGIRISPKPALEARASELAAALARFDVCCLCEVWTDDSRSRILRGLEALGSTGWQAAAGPGDAGAWMLAGSGLFCLARHHPIVASHQMIFANRGERRRDSDAWSNKGVLLNVIDVGLGRLELFQTHLYYGGGLPGIPMPAPAERLQVWRAELDELAAFYRQHHRPENIAIITGDFNMSGANPGEYAAIRGVMNGLNMRDLWAWEVYRHAPGKGYTNRFTDGDPSQWKRDFGDVCQIVPAEVNRQDPLVNSCADLPNDVAAPSGVGRYDYVFVENPTPDHSYNLEVSRLQRRPCPRPAVTELEGFMSDHLGLDLSLYLSPR